MSAALESIVELTAPAAVAAEIGRINTLVARNREVPEQAWDLVKEMSARLDRLEVSRWGAIDPYLQAVFLRGFAQATKALQERDRAEARNLVRTGLERMRHALQEIADAAKVGDERSPKQLVSWLSEILPVSQRELAAILGVNARKLQRWLHGANEPEGDDALRVTVVARIVNQLRHSLTPVGVLRWFDRTRAELGGRKPRTLLASAEHIPQLIELAASIRHSDAT
jgi:DNA-binding transcriptional regulator YiaG